MNKTNKWSGIFTFTTFLLAGCGGGGGGGGGGNSEPVVSTQSFNVKTAMATYDSMPHSYRFSGSGTFGGAAVTITGTGATSALSSATFEGQTVLQQTQTTNLTLTDSNGSRPLDGVLTLFYLPADYTPLGSISSTNRYEVTDLPVTFPTSAKVGDRGFIRTTKYYADGTKTTQTGDSETGYLIEADTATSVVVKFVSRQNYSLPSAVTQIETVRYRLDSIGALTLLADSIEVGNDKLIVEPIQ